MAKVMRKEAGIRKGRIEPQESPWTGTEPRSPALQVDSLPAEPPGKALYLYRAIIIFIYMLVFYIHEFCLCRSNQSISKIFLKIPKSCKKENLNYVHCQLFIIYTVLGIIRNFEMV